MAISSDEAQYFPRRNSRTNTGTLAPTLTFRTRSLRTTLPAKSRFALSSSASRTGAPPLLMARLRAEQGCRQANGRALRRLLGPAQRRAVRLHSRRLG